MKKLLLLLTILLLALPIELSAKHIIRHHVAKAQTSGCGVGQTPPSTGCGISDLSVGGALAATDAIALCQQGSGGCPATASTWKLTQLPLLSAIRNALSATAPLTYNAATGNFGFSGSSGGGGVNPGTLGQAAYYNIAGSTVSGNPNVTYLTGMTQLNYNAATSFPAFGGSAPHLLIIGADNLPSKIGQLTFNNVAGSTTTMAASGGTGGAPSALPAGAAMGTFGFAGYDGTNLSSSALMRGVSVEAGAFTSGAHGSKLVFATTPIGSTAPVDGLTIDSTQNVTIAGQNGAGFGCIHADANGKQSRMGADCGTASGGNPPGGATNTVQINAGGGAFGAVPAGTATGQVLQYNVGTAPSWVSPSSGAPPAGATNALQINAGGGLFGSLPAGSAGQFLQSNGAAAASWVAAPSGGGLSGMTAGQIPVAATATTATSSLPLSGTSGATQVASATSAAKASGHMAVYDANGNLIDGGLPSSGGGATPVAGSLTNSNGTTFGAVALGTNLSLAGSYPNQTLNAAAGTFTLAPGFTTTPGTQNTGTQTITSGTGQTVNGQLWPSDKGAGTYTVGPADTGNLLSTTAPGVTFQLPNPGTRGATYQINADGTNPYTVTTLSGSATFKGCRDGNGQTIWSTQDPFTATFLTDDGVGYRCIESNTAPAAPIDISWGPTTGSPDGFIIHTFGTAVRSFVDVRGTLGPAEGSAGTVAIELMANGSACATGNEITTAAFNTNTTPNTIQSFTLATTNIPANTYLCLKTTGTFATNKGSLSIRFR